MRTFLSFAFIILASIIYIRYLDAKNGLIILYFFTLLPLLSVLITFLTKNKIEIELDIKDDILTKNHKSKLKLMINKKIRLPIPFVSIKIQQVEHFDKLEIDTFRISMSEEKKFKTYVEFTPRICGKTEIIVSEAYIYDYLGIYKFNLLKNNIIMKTVYIKPDIPEIEQNNELFRNICTNVFNNDDDESNSTFSFNLGSIPGYEYRNYVPGDSMKKINWKLSSKRDELMVRLDEVAPFNKPTIIIDYVKSTQIHNYRERLLTEERVLEAALGMMLLCVKQGLECYYEYLDKTEWTTQVISNVDDIKIAAINIGKNIFLFNSNRETRFPSFLYERKKSVGVVLFFTTELDKNIISELEELLRLGTEVDIITSNNNPQNIIGNNVWLIDEYYNISPSI